MPAIAFALAAAIFAAGGVQVSGYFPQSTRPSALRGGFATLSISALLIGLLALLAAAIWFAVARLSWPPAVIAGGLGLLAGPLVWQLVRSRADRPIGIATGAALTGAAAAGLAFWAAAPPSPQG